MPVVRELSTVIQGLNWAATSGVQIANLSLGGFDFFLGSNPVCTAIANAVSGGMTVVAAAGNSKFDALYFTSANCRYSLTISASADFDGAAGGLVTPTSSVRIMALMAPGVDIVSTLPTYR